MWTELLGCFITPSPLDPVLPKSTDICTLEENHQITKGWYKIQGHMVNIRNSPTLNGTVLKEIPIASLANVSECIKAETIGHKTGCWHQVTDITVDNITTHYEDAYIFSSAIAPCFLHADFDLDGVYEEVFLSSIKPDTYQVRLWDPNAKKSVVTTEYEPELTKYIRITAIIQDNVNMLKLTSGSGEGCAYINENEYLMYINTDTQNLYRVLSTTDFSNGARYSSHHSIKWLNREHILLQVEDRDDKAKNSHILSTQHYCLKEFKFEPCSEKIEINTVLPE